jgi:hypothetical protein
MCTCEPIPRERRDRYADYCREVDARNHVATYAYILPHCLNWRGTEDYDVLLTWRSEAPGYEGKIPLADLRRWNAVAVERTPDVPPHAPGHGYPVQCVLWDTGAYEGIGGLETSL